MNVGFVGLGKLGLPVALAVESKGHTVIGCDVSERVRRSVRSRSIEYEEEGAQELLDKSEIEVTDVSDVVARSEIIFVCVQTPHDHMYEGVTRLPESRKDFNYGFLREAVKEINEVAESIGEDRVVAIVSTVLPGTYDGMIRSIHGDHVKVAYNPSFIAMGTTIPDFLSPEMVLIGVDDIGAAATLRRFYFSITQAAAFMTSVKNAEIIKVLYNTFISTKIAFANTVMELCHKIGADCDSVIEAMGLATRRIVSTSYMHGGMGDGGGCHPRDNIALSWLSRKLELSHDLFSDIMRCREDQTEWIADLAINLAEESGLQVCVLGKSFKAGTNITTGSPAALLVEIIREKGVLVDWEDPIVDKSLLALKDPCVYVIATAHDVFMNMEYPEGSIILDPWRKVTDRSGVRVIRIGEGNASEVRRYP